MSRSDFYRQSCDVVGVALSAVVRAQKQAFGSSVAQLDSVHAHHVKHFIVYPAVQLVASFRLDKVK